VQEQQHALGQAAAVVAELRLGGAQVGQQDRRRAEQRPAAALELGRELLDQPRAPLERAGLHHRARQRQHLAGHGIAELLAAVVARVGGVDHEHAAAALRVEPAGPAPPRPRREPGPRTRWPCRRT
jgi:hypothetical protein